VGFIFHHTKSLSAHFSRKKRSADQNANHNKEDLMNRKKYTTDRLIIRPIVSSDYLVWKKFYSGLDPSKNEWDLENRSEKDCGRKIFREIIARHRLRAKEDACYIYGAFCKKRGTLIGVIDICIIKRGWYEMANLGYRI
jgi:hypothetical protein